MRLLLPNGDKVQVSGCRGDVLIIAVQWPGNKELLVKTILSVCDNSSSEED